MPIRHLLELQAEAAAFGPDDIKAIIAGYEAVLKRLKVDDRKSAMALLVAKTTIQVAKEGERDPERLSERVIRRYRVNLKQAPEKPTQN
jgi:hypothetical protein